MVMFVFFVYAMIMVVMAMVVMIMVVIVSAHVGWEKQSTRSHMDMGGGAVVRLSG